jgi:hypothetical protein
VRREEPVRGQEPLRSEESVRREEEVIRFAGAAEPRADGAWPPPLAAPQLAQLARSRREAMRAAGREIGECYRVLRKGGLNVVGEVLRGQGEFVENEHYPRDDVYDPESHAQYYYHAHRSVTGEHGHFHTFLRAPGMPPGAAPLPAAHSEPWPEGGQAIAHLIGISMDAYGYPAGLFAPNRWVCGDTWYPVDELVPMLERFRIDHASPSWPVNRWISAMFVLFRPHIEALLIERDRVIGAWREALPGEDVWERRDLEVLSYMPISVERIVAELDGAPAA